MKSYDKLFDIIKKLRAPDGCPWDREQTPLSMTPALIEESYELIEAIEDGDFNHIAEEIGDLILVATMIGYMHEEENKFSLDDALNSVSEKLIRRHPHVFSDLELKNSEEVLKNWDKIKIEVEGRKSKTGLNAIPKSLPPLERAYKIQKKVSKQGFDWDTIAPIFDKLYEEIDELKVELNAPIKDKELIIGECGDILFSAINICRKLKVDPSIALDRTNRKFTSRFNYVEKEMAEKKLEMNSDSFEEMDRLWEEAKTK